VLDGKVVIVTGGARGIGRYAASTFAHEKAKVVIADIDRSWLETTSRELGQFTEVWGISTDVCSEASVRGMVHQVIAKYGQIDVLVNDAAIVPHFAWGIPRWPPIRHMDKGFWDRVIQTNLGGTFLCTKYVLPHMESRKSGHIINLYGGGGVKPAGACAYVVTKDAIRTFTRYVAEEVIDSNVCVVILSPGGAIATEGAPEEARHRLPGPEILGNGFVLAAELPMDLSGQLFSYQNGRLVGEP
jgi:NAD(P)-dependent dehydrogenase (short-subunit alcohol dehydrogenase family)